MKMAALGREVRQYGPQAPIFEAGNCRGGSPKACHPERNAVQRRISPNTERSFGRLRLPQDDGLTMRSLGRLAPWRTIFEAGNCRGGSEIRPYELLPPKGGTPNSTRPVGRNPWRWSSVAEACGSSFYWYLFALFAGSSSEPLPNLRLRRERAVRLGTPNSWSTRPSTRKGPCPERQWAYCR